MTHGAPLFRRLGQACVAMTLLGACTTEPKPPPGAVTLVYSGNVDGEIEPCG